MEHLTLVLGVAGLSLVITAVLFVIFSPRWTFGQSALWLLVIVLVPVLGGVVFLVADEWKRRRGPAAPGSTAAMKEGGIRSS
jgi:hypothetical protein